MKVITIGRSDEGNDVIINDPMVSRHHFQIVQDDDGSFRLADFGSTNGTYINGQKVSGEVGLDENDIIRVGNTTIPWRHYFDSSYGSFPETEQPFSTPYSPSNVTSVDNKKKMKTMQIIFITLLAVYAVFATIVLFSTVDEIEKLIWLGGVVGASMLIGSFCLKYKLCNRPVAITEPNGEQPGYLGSFMGIGTHLLGRSSRFREYEGTWVAYAFVWFILPLYPSGCYRVKLLSSGYGNEWAIYGSEKSDPLEVLYLYLSLYGLLLWSFSIVFCLLVCWL